MTEAEENAAVAEISQKLEQEAVAEFQQANPELGQALQGFVKERQEPSFFTCVKCGKDKGRIRMPSHMCGDCDAETYPQQYLREFVKENQTTAGRLAALDDVETLRTGNSPEFPDQETGGIKNLTPRWEPAYPLPLSDLCERLEMCARAGVTLYRDANIELHFDPDARKRNDPNGPDAGAIRERF